jgi:rhamnosyltransferase
MTEDNRCAIVIRTFNEENHLGRLLTSIQEQTKIADEVVVVDSGSTDATCDIATQHEAKIIHIPKEDFSFGYALNQGISNTTCMYIALISAHCYPVNQTWLEELIRPFSDPKVGLVYGRQQGNSQSKFSENQLLKKWFPHTSFNRQKYPFCNNANAAIRRNLWKKVPYNEDLTGLEDLDWAKQILRKGHYIAYNASAGIIHVHDESYAQVYNRYRREAITMKRLYERATFSLWDFVKLGATNIFSDFIAAQRQRVLVEHAIDIVKFRACQFWGTYKGYQLTTDISPELRERFYYPLQPETKAEDTYE